MANNQFNIFEDDAKKMMDGLRKQYEKGFSEDMDRAAVIVEEEYYKLLTKAAVSGVTGVLADANVVVKRKRKFRDIPRSIKVYIPDSGGDTADIVFNVLDSGRAALGPASAYGMKAWPMSFPRRIDFGNSPMTRAGSPNISVAYSGEPLKFARSINKPIRPRKFVQHILEQAQKRLNDEGLDYIELIVSEQD